MFGKVVFCQNWVFQKWVVNISWGVGGGGDCYCEGCSKNPKKFFFEHLIARCKNRKNMQKKANKIFCTPFLGALKAYRNLFHFFSPIASFLRHCNTMDSPPIPSFVRGGPQAADDVVYLSRDASMESLQQLQRYSEKLQFEATCVRLWANGIQDQIMDEQEKVQNWISGMTDEINRLRRVQPAWIQHLQSQGNQQPPMSMPPAPSSQPAQASSSASSTVPVKAAPAPRNSSMASAPKNAPFPKTQGADPWAEAKTRQQRQ